jgi:hypothetical protein
MGDPEVLAEAAAAASLGLDTALRAGGEIARDGPIKAAALRLLGAGANKAPGRRRQPAPVRGRAALGGGWARSAAYWA